MRSNSPFYQFRLLGPLCMLFFFVSFTQRVQSQPCPGQDCRFLRVSSETDPNSQLSLGGITSFSVDAAGRFGGRFYIANSGNIGINLASNASDDQLLAKFHLRLGTTILGGNTLISGNTTTQSNWVKGTNPNNNDPNWGLWVDKGVVATDYAITNSDNWADFVFEPNYRLRPLREVEHFIKANRHLPEIPSAADIKEKGYTLQDMNSKFMQKIEELTLYTIEQDKQIQALQKQVQNLALQMETKKTKRRAKK